MNKGIPVSTIFAEFSNYLKKSDVYSAKVRAEVSSILIKKQRQLKMNQKEFAKFMNVTQGMISKWESGDYNFTVDAIAMLCEKIGYTFDIILEDEYATDRKTYIDASSKSIVGAQGWGNLIDMSNKSDWAGAA